MCALQVFDRDVTTEQAIQRFFFEYKRKEKKGDEMGIGGKQQDVVSGGHQLLSRVPRRGNAFNYVDGPIRSR